MEPKSQGHSGLPNTYGDLGTCSLLSAPQADDAPRIDSSGSFLLPHEVGTKPRFPATRMLLSGGRGVEPRGHSSLSTRPDHEVNWAACQ